MADNMEWQVNPSATYIIYAELFTFVCILSQPPISVTQELRYTLWLLQPVSKVFLAGESISNGKMKRTFMAYWLIFWAYLHNKNHFYKYSEDFTLSHGFERTPEGLLMECQGLQQEST